MFTDIVGYTEQMSKDEDRAFALIKKKRELLLPLIDKYEGKLIKEIGDGTLTRYFRVDNAIKCASTFQAITGRDLNVRAGIHTGTVIMDEEDVFGDVVNVASRIESIAVPGSVLVSKETIDKLEISDSIELVSLGMQSLKGIGRLIEVFAIKNDSLVVPDPETYKENKINVHSDAEVPSVAIIPFNNKGPEEDVFYAYGISVDLISDVSSAGLIRVASKKKIEDAGDLPQDELAQKLDVRYMANGELWRMEDVFQLSVELYDTKEKKVLWSDRWQEKWDNLPTIKIKLSDGILKALDTTIRAEDSLETANTKAYELYLKAKHTFDKRTDNHDIEKARMLLRQAIEIDNTLIVAKVALGNTYSAMGDYGEAMRVFNLAREQAEDLNDKTGIGQTMNNIGVLHYYRGEYDKALEHFDKTLTIQEELDNKERVAGALHNIGLVHYGRDEYDKALKYYVRSLKIKKQLGDKAGMGITLSNIGQVHRSAGEYNKALEHLYGSLKIYEIFSNKAEMVVPLVDIGIVHDALGDYDQALKYYEKSLKIDKELGDKAGMGTTLSCIGNVHLHKGEYGNAFDHYERSLKINKEVGDRRALAFSLLGIGAVYYNMCDYKNAAVHFQKSLNIQKEVGFKRIKLETTTYLYLSYTHIGKEYHRKNIYSLIKDADNIEFEINFRLYQLLNEISYLETAYKQVQDKASDMKKDIKIRFLSYPIITAIMEERKKLNN